MNSSSALPDDLDPLEHALLEGIARLEGTIEPWPPGPLDPLTATVCLEAQVTSRHLDHTARWLRARGKGYYTIGSAGHESNAAVALALRPTDPALLHYRSGGFYVARASQLPGHDPMLGCLRACTPPLLPAGALRVVAVVHQHLGEVGDLVMHGEPRPDVDV